MDANGVQIHQYAAGRIRAELATGTLILDVETSYPATGRIKLTVAEAPGTPVSISLRVPAWATGATLDAGEGTLPAAPGTTTVTRAFRPGQQIILDLPIDPRFSWPDDRIDAVRGCVAIERGPEVYALESIDLPAGWELSDARIDTTASLIEKDGTVTARLVGLHRGKSGTWPFTSQNGTMTAGGAQVTLVPYHSWAERGNSTMRIWIPVYSPTAR